MIRAALTRGLARRRLFKEINTPSLLRDTAAAADALCRWRPRRAHPVVFLAGNQNAQNDLPIQIISFPFGRGVTQVSWFSTINIIV